MSLGFDIANLIALATSLLIAVQVSERLARSRERIDAKRELLLELFSHRHIAIGPELYPAFNSIPIVYRDNATVLNNLRAFLEVVGDPRNPALRLERYETLIVTMAQASGYKKFTEKDCRYYLRDG